MDGTVPPDLRRFVVVHDLVRDITEQHGAASFQMLKRDAARHGLVPHDLAPILETLREMGYVRSLPDGRVRATHPRERQP